MSDVDRAIRMFPAEEELPLYEMAVGDRPFRLREFDFAVERIVEEYICGLSEEDIRRIRGDGSGYDSLPEREQELLGKMATHEGVRWDALVEAFDVEYSDVHAAEHHELYGDAV
ncbi:hypothetical protein [Halorussus salinisoli]|uniref:hypothetical protein n=1 Tax=Halorussus salinisoli TaxID=2558242 RepID=UPI0010C1DA39|nr:hypothetical protein [Halorussus salinisoli]